LGNELYTKIKLTKIIVKLMNRENDLHLQADLYKLTNKSLNKVLACFEAYNTARDLIER